MFYKVQQDTLNGCCKQNTTLMHAEKLPSERIGQIKTKQNTTKQLE